MSIRERLQDPQILWYQRNSIRMKHPDPTVFGTIFPFYKRHSCVGQGCKPCIKPTETQLDWIISRLIIDYERTQ